MCQHFPPFRKGYWQWALAGTHDVAHNSTARSLQNKTKPQSMPISQVLFNDPFTGEGGKIRFKEALTVLKESLQKADVFSHTLAQNTAWHPG